ncbi:hypothetical protein Lal_00013449 [Lupinus albus]|nr:hypothetical protein Lal_00013449 [Lupinus albus]
MWDVFLEWGKVVDVVIPPRLDKYGKRFGFVRFLGILNPKLMVAKLDRIWIGHYKIWVNIPKYGRKSDSSPPKKAPLASFPPLGGASTTGIMNTTVPTLRDEHNFIGVVFDNIDPKGIKDKLFLDGFYFIHCTILGGRMILLRAEEEGELESFIKDEPEWFNSRFRVLHKWEPRDVALERFTWIRCYGVPLQIWEENFFHNLASLFGTYLGQNVCTRSKHTLEIPTYATVNKTIRVKIDNFDYDIRVVEDLVSCWHQGKHPSSQIYSDSRSSESDGSWIDRALDEHDSVWVIEEEEVCVTDGVSEGVVTDVSAWATMVNELDEDGGVEKCPKDSPRAIGLVHLNNLGVVADSVAGRQPLSASGKELTAINSLDLGFSINSKGSCSTNDGIFPIEPSTNYVDQINYVGDINESSIHLIHSKNSGTTSIIVESPVGPVDSINDANTTVPTLRDERKFADVVKFGHASPSSIPQSFPLTHVVELEFQSNEQSPL